MWKLAFSVSVENVVNKTKMYNTKYFKIEWIKCIEILVYSVYDYGKIITIAYIVA